MSKNDLSFRVAEVNFRVRVQDVDDARKLLPSYAPFNVKRIAETDCQMVMNVADGLVPFEADGEEVGNFDCGDSAFGVYRTSDGGYRILISDLSHERACALHASAHFERCEASLFGDENQKRYGLNNALMVAFAFAAAHFGVLLMHSSVTMFEGRGYLFLGKSGTGKSTHSSLWRKYIPGSDLLNDDNPAVRAYADGRVVVFGTPWSGKTPCYRNLSLPVGAFVRLEQYPSNEIRRDSRLEEFASVLSSCSTMIWDKPSYDAILASITRILRSGTPGFYLRCLPDEAAAQLSRKTIAYHHS